MREILLITILANNDNDNIATLKITVLDCDHLLSLYFTVSQHAGMQLVTESYATHQFGHVAQTGQL